MKRSNRGVPVEERFWMKVQKTDGCWLWTGAKSALGRPVVYGKIQYASYDKRSAHRVSWEMHNGPIPDGLFVLHHCDVGLCVRPDHLFLGTQLDNMRDRLKKGRAVFHVGPRDSHCKRGHEFTPENTRTFRRGERGVLVRVCRACGRIRDRAHYATHRESILARKREAWRFIGRAS